MPLKSAHLFDAFSNRFSSGQLQDIMNMSHIANEAGITLHEALLKYPPKVINKKIATDKKRLLNQMKCPNCGRKLNISQVAKLSEKYKEGYRTYMLCGASCCPGKGCGYEEFSSLTIEKIKKSKPS